MAGNVSVRDLMDLAEQVGVKKAMEAAESKDDRIDIKELAEWMRINHRDYLIRELDHITLDIKKMLANFLRGRSG